MVRRPTDLGHGHYVVFQTNAEPSIVDGLHGNIFVRDRARGVTTRVSVSSSGARNDASNFEPAISANGRVVAFVSNATNLVPDDTNGAYDVFARTR